MRIHIFTSCLALLLAAACYGETIITPEQAMNAVWDFEGNNTLQLDCRPLDEYEWELDYFDVRYHIEEAQNESASWTVDAVTGEVTGVIYHYTGTEGEWTETSPGPLTQGECRQIAENFARAKFSGFDTMGFQIYQEEWQGRGWYFQWCQRIAYGAWAPSSVDIGVNGVDGRIQSYSCVRDQTPTPQQPQTTEQQAIDIVRAATGIGTEYEFVERREPELSANRYGITWGFIITGEDAQGKYHECSACVDAITGVILDLSCDSGWGSSYAPKPSVAGGDLVCVRDLTTKFPGAQVHWLGKEGAKLFVGKNRYTLVPGKDTIEWTGGNIKLSQKMKLESGRLMVPSGLLDVLKSAPTPKKASPGPAKSK